MINLISNHSNFVFFYNIYFCNHTDLVGNKKIRIENEKKIIIPKNIIKIIN